VRDRFSVLTLVAACLFLFFWRLGERDLWNSHEARAGMNAQSILADDWTLPHLNDGRAELQKPPLFYWLVALVGSIQGEVDAWTVRLPSAIAALMCVMLLVWHDRRIGLFAGVILATSVHFTWLARTARIDMPLTTVIALSLLLLHRAQSDRRWLIGVYLCFAAALLLKGPIGVVLPVAVWLVWLLSEGKLHPRNWLSLLNYYGVWWGIPLVIALVLPWCLWVQAKTDGEWFRVFVWFHNVERGVGGSRLRGHPWWFYLPQGVVDLLPWSLLLLPALVWWFRNGGWREDATGRFGLLWAVTMTVLLSLARYKRADYLVPAYPGYALFLGSAVVRWFVLLPSPPEYRGRGVGGEGVPFLPARSASEEDTLACASGCQIRRPLSPYPSPRSTGARGVSIGVLAITVVGWFVYLTAIQPRCETRREMHSFAHSIHTSNTSSLPIVLFQTENHLLAFHLGRPLEILLHWQDLRRFAHSGALVVLPHECYERLAHELPDVVAVPLFDNRPHEKPLLVVRIATHANADSLQGPDRTAVERTASD